MSRTTLHDLDIEVRRLGANLIQRGLLAEGEHLVLQHGSKTQGVSYQLYIVQPGGLETSRPFGNLHFGFTAADAERTLNGINAGIEYVGVVTS